MFSKEFKDVEAAVSLMRHASEDNRLNVYFCFMVTSGYSIEDASNLLQSYLKARKIANEIMKY